MFGTIFSILAIIVLICIIVAVVLLSQRKLKELRFEQKAIPKFHKDVHFDPYPQVINIENQHDCNVHSLRVCDINDSTTLFGCKELIVRCHHFEHDTPYVDNNVTTIIPKNDKPNEGYALAITSIAEACNPYHGDITLITSNAENSEYMLVCTCKHPGYIGNETILGNCTTVFICNGKIDDINKPLANINCVCENNQKTIRYQDGLPVCKDLLVHEANELYDDWSSIVPWISNRQINVERYNPTVSGNLKTSRLLDPCRNSLINPSIEIPDARFNPAKGQCTVHTSGYPVVNGLLRFKESKNNKTGVSAVIATGKYESVRFSDNIAGIRRVYGIVIDGLPHTKFQNTRIVVQPPNGITIGLNHAISFPSKTQFVAPVCEGHWPTYSCNDVRPKDSRIVANLAVATGRNCPSTFLWSRDEWDDNEFLAQRSISYKNDVGYTLSPINLSKVKYWRAYGVQWTPKNSIANTGIVFFPSDGDFQTHLKVLSD